MAAAVLVHIDRWVVADDLADSRGNADRPNDVAVVVGHFDKLWLLENTVDRQVVNNTLVHRDTVNNSLQDMRGHNAFGHALIGDMVGFDVLLRPQPPLLLHERLLVGVADVVAAVVVDCDGQRLPLRRHCYYHFVVDNDRVPNRRRLVGARNRHPRWAMHLVGRAPEDVRRHRRPSPIVFGI